MARGREGLCCSQLLGVPRRHMAYLKPHLPHSPEGQRGVGRRSPRPHGEVCLSLMRSSVQVMWKGAWRVARCLRTRTGGSFSTQPPASGSHSLCLSCRAGKYGVHRLQGIRESRSSWGDSGSQGKANSPRSAEAARPLAARPGVCVCMHTGCTPGIGLLSHLEASPKHQA